MPNIKPVSDLRNYSEVLHDVAVGAPVFLTKNGRGRYAIVDMQDYERTQAIIRLMNELAKGRHSGETEGWLTSDDMRAHYPRYSTIRGNFQIVAIYKDFKEISSDNVTTILESPATDSPFSVLQNFPFAGRTISRSNPGYACSQSPVKAQRTVRS